jgi:CIC family chloride channel protein
LREREAARTYLIYSQLKTIKAAAGFGLVGIIGVRYPQVFGVGYESVDAVLSQHIPALRAFALAALKPVATSLTLGAGGSGGIFAPSLFTGAMLGDAFGTVVHTAFPTWTAGAAAYGLVAMSAVFAAAAEAPITSIMIVFEMSNDYTIILPLSGEHGDRHASRPEVALDIPFMR